MTTETRAKTELYMKNFFKQEVAALVSDPLQYGFACAIVTNQFETIS